MKLNTVILMLSTISLTAQNQSNVFYKTAAKDTSKQDSVVVADTVIKKSELSNVTTASSIEPVYLSGDITCDETFEPVAAKISFYKGINKVAETASNPADGIYKIDLDDDGKIKIKVEAKGYKTKEATVFIMEEDHGHLEELFINVVPTNADSIFKIEDVFFNKLQDTIAGPQRAVLDKMVEYLRTHPKVSIKIMGHADFNEAGDKTENLANRRAWFVNRYLHWKGIDTKRMVEFGYGDDRPLAKSNEPENPENRRVVFKIIAY